MSAAPNDGSSAIVEMFATLYKLNLIGLAPPVMFLYEYIVTFDQEVSLFWGRKITGATVLFFATRYLALLSYVVFGLALLAPMSSDKSCTVLANFQAYTGVIQFIAWGAFSALRTLALSKMNRALASAVFVLSLGPFVINMWQVSNDLVGVIIEPFGCIGTSNTTPNVAVMSVAISRSCAIVADILVLAVTWRSKLTTSGVVAGTSSSPLGRVLLVNGTIYFLVIAIFNILQITLTPISILLSANDVSIITIFGDPMSAILIARFMMALQSTHQRELGQASTGGLGGEDRSPADGDSLRFASRVIGSIGASIHAGQDASLFEDYELEGPEESVSQAAEDE